MLNLSVIILTRNEEKNILDCLETVLSAREIIIIDDFSEDRTVEIIKRLNKKNIRIIQRKLDNDFSEQRNFALQKARGDWVLFLDADERVSPQLLAEIESKINEADSVAFLIKRRDFMWGKELKHGETGNIKLVRLAKKDAGKWQGKVHEIWDIKENVSLLDNPLVHYPHPTVYEFLKEINIYSSIRAEELRRNGVNVKLWEIFVYPKVKFFQNYFIRLGFLDGIPGLIAALMMSFHSFLVRAKLWQLARE